MQKYGLMYGSFIVLTKKEKIDMLQDTVQFADTMPHHPKEFRIPHYALPDTFGRMEDEEVAARIIEHCKQKGEWCRIELDPFLSGIELEYLAIKQDSIRRNDLLEYNKQSKAVYKKNMFLYRLKMATTLGMYRFFGNRPVTPNVKTVPKHYLPFTGAIFGIRHVHEGIRGLVQKDAIQIDVAQGKHWIVPTSKLLEPLSRFRVS
ncbi:MAG: hypothetical protein HOI24_03685 [Candidatus Magasanikbacteria bacterium]|nr:hypothetical protein [Candidatus Magasanikbacteria bacterium]